MAERVNGVFAPISTPFIDEEIAYAHLEENINKYSQTSLSGLLVLGSNGESKSLTEDEKLKVLFLSRASSEPTALAQWR